MEQKVHNYLLQFLLIYGALIYLISLLFFEWMFHTKFFSFFGQELKYYDHKSLEQYINISSGNSKRWSLIF